MNDDYWTVQAMKEFGGSFVKALADAFFSADDHNRHLIKETWPGPWEHYLRLGQQLKRKDEAKEQA